MKQTKSYTKHKSLMLIAFVCILFLLSLFIHQKGPYSLSQQSKTAICASEQKKFCQNKIKFSFSCNYSSAPLSCTKAALILGSDPRFDWSNKESQIDFNARIIGGKSINIEITSDDFEYIEPITDDYSLYIGNIDSINISATIIRALETIRFQKMENHKS